MPPVGSDRITTEYAALRSSVAVREVARDVLSVSGPDAASYLQGQCSQDVEGLGPGESADSLLLSPQGKVDALLRMTRTAEDRFIVDTDTGFGPAVVERLRRFLLRMRVEIEPLEWMCVGLRGPGAVRAAVSVRPEVVADVAWPGFSGIDLLGPAPTDGLGGWVEDQVQRCGEPAWEAARIEAGQPVNGREVVEGSIAAELGLVERTVSFTKGCFTGQELVARIDARGSKVARRLCGVVVAGQPDLVASVTGAGVLTADGSHEVGHLSSVAWSPGSGAVVALATLHRRVEPPEAVVVRWEDGAGRHELVAESRPLPLVAGPEATVSPTVGRAGQ